jgi:hypothetical protein
MAAPDFMELQTFAPEHPTDEAQWLPMELRLAEDLPIARWSDIGRKLVRMDQVTKWWLGDWAAFGLRKYGQLKEFAEANGVSYQTLRNLAWVSEKVELSRRRDNVDWSKHAEVAALPAKEQAKWLGKAEEMPVVELRRQIRQSGAKEGHNALESDGPVMRFASRWCDDLVRWLKERPDGFWTKEAREAWKGRLEPLVKIWESL